MRIDVAEFLTSVGSGLGRRDPVRMSENAIEVVRPLRSSYRA
jgi:hypothetical protein